MPDTQNHTPHRKPGFLKALEGFSPGEYADCAYPGNPAPVTTTPTTETPDWTAIGQRFTRAREMNGLSQSAAAERLGYKNSAPLSKIESGIAPAPVWLLGWASQIYGVSADYLVGLSSLHQRDPRTVMQTLLVAEARQAIEQHAREVTLHLVAQAIDPRDALSAMDALANGADEFLEALQAFRKHNNRRFEEELRGGARLQRDAEALQNAIVACRRLLVRHRVAEGLTTAVDSDLDEESGCPDF